MTNLESILLNQYLCLLFIQKVLMYFIINSSNQTKRQLISPHLTHQKMIKQEEIQDQQQELKQKIADKQAIESLTQPLNSHDQFHTLLLKEFKDMKGTAEQKKKRLMHRLQKFFLKDIKINIKNGYFCKRRQPSYKSYQKQKLNQQIKLLENEVIIFGIDFIKIRQIVKAYLPVDFKNIDMSHIKLIFKDFEHAMESLRRNMREDVIENETKLEPDQISPPKGWTEMRPYYLNNYERRLLARFATEQQKDLTRSQKIQSEVSLYAKKVYNLKKKQSEDIEENYRIRQELIREKKMENWSRKSNHKNEQQNYDENNYNKINEYPGDDKKSQKSLSLRIGGRRNEEQKSESNRQRSREKDFQDNRSVSSKKSSASSLINRFDNNLNLGERAQSESVLSDVSFILDQDQNKELFEDMAIRLGLINIYQNNASMEEDSISVTSKNKMEHSFSSSKSSSSRAYRSLTGDLPDRPNEPNEPNEPNGPNGPNESFNDHSFTKKKWNYKQYVDEQLEAERKREEQKKQEKIFISLIDDEE